MNAALSIDLGIDDFLNAVLNHRSSIVISLTCRLLFLCQCFVQENYPRSHEFLFCYTQPIAEAKS